MPENPRSLFSHRKTLSPNTFNTSLMLTPLQSTNTFGTIQITHQFNDQCNSFIEIYSQESNKYQQALNQKLQIDSNFRGHRSKGVELAWKYEQADIAMGGKGISKWNESQRQEIRDTGRVRGAEGHHLKSVAAHPEDQTDPNNIEFYGNHRKHKDEGHRGDFRNESNADKIDKDSRLQNTNRKRVIKNELKGAGIAAIIGFVSGASIAVIVTLIQNGISPDSLKQAAVNAGKGGVEGMAFGLINHAASRAIGEVATNAMTGLLSNFGVQVTENVVKACNMGVVGSIAIVTFSAYQFYKLKKAGYTTKDSLVKVGKQAAISVSSLAVTVIVQSTCGGPAALAVSISIGAIVLSYSMYQMYHDKVLAENIQCYAINKSYPIYIY